MVGRAVPEGLAATPPGPELARMLSAVDAVTVPNDDIVDVLEAWSRQLAYDQARLFEAMTEVICRRPFAAPLEIRREDHPDQYGADEVRAALCWTRRHAEGETHLAYTLTRVLPLVQQALLEGRIDRGRAWVFAHHLVDLSPEQITAVCAALLPFAPRLTTGQIAERIKRMILELDPAYAERRYRKGVRDRMVVAFLNADGTAVISARGLPADEAAAAWERIDAMARAARSDGHPGTLDQVRADVALGLWDGSLDGSDRAGVLQALLARFAGHAEPAQPDAGEPAGAMPVRQEPGARPGRRIRAQAVPGSTPARATPDRPGESDPGLSHAAVRSHRRQKGRGPGPRSGFH